MNPELICPPYILWLRRICAGSDPSSPDPQPVVVRSTTRRRAISAVVVRRTTRHCSISAVVARATPVVARATPVVARPYTRRRVLRTRRRPIFLNFRTRRSALYTRCRELSTRRRALRIVIAMCATRRRDPSRARPAPVRASPISTHAYFFFPALCQSIPACICHGHCLRDSPWGANCFSSHVIYHH